MKPIGTEPDSADETQAETGRLITTAVAVDAELLALTARGAGHYIFVITTDSDDGSLATVGNIELRVNTSARQGLRRLSTAGGQVAGILHLERGDKITLNVKAPDTSRTYYGDLSLTRVHFGADRAATCACEAR